MTTMALSLPTVLAGLDPSKAVQHVINHKFPLVDGEFWWWSSAASNLVITGLIMCLLGPWIAKRIATGPESQGHDRYVTRNPFAHMVEVICSYLRDEIVRPLLHDRTDKFMPFLWTLFFFILVNNLLGLIPLLDLQHALSPEMKKEHTAFLGGTATQSVYVTGALAVISFFVINGAGIARLGVGGYFAHLTAGAPWYVWPLIVPVEIVGTFIKPVALAIRLFANMTAGHILLATMFALSGAWIGTGLGAGMEIGIVLVASVGAIAVLFLEIFVAILQAFIFFFLTTVFMSLLDHHDEEHSESHDHAHGGHEPAHA